MELIRCSMTSLLLKNATVLIGTNHAEDNRATSILCQENFIFLYLVPYVKGIIHFKKSLITGPGRSAMDTISLTQEKTYF